MARFPKLPRAAGIRPLVPGGAGLRYPALPRPTGRPTGNRALGPAPGNGLPGARAAPSSWPRPSGTGMAAGVLAPAASRAGRTRCDVPTGRNRAAPLDPPRLPRGTGPGTRREVGGPSRPTAGPSAGRCGLGGGPGDAGDRDRLPSEFPAVGPTSRGAPRSRCPDPSADDPRERALESSCFPGSDRGPWRTGSDRARSPTCGCSLRGELSTRATAPLLQPRGSPLYPARRSLLHHRRADGSEVPRAHPLAARPGFRGRLRGSRLCPGPDRSVRGAVGERGAAKRR